jgi:hypothetical protein
MRAKLIGGTKTQTRRVLTEAGITCDSVVEGRVYCIAGSGRREELDCPYGSPGDALRVPGEPKLLLQITSVRAERLDAISVGDALAEGVEPGSDPVSGYRAIWDWLNAERGFGWATNPWVWVISFVRLE